MGRGGRVTYLSLEPYPYEGVEHVLSREVPLPLTREEVREGRGPLTDGTGFPYAEAWRLRYPEQCDAVAYTRTIRSRAEP